MNKDKDYWIDFYKKHRENAEPSSFAVYVFEKYLQDGQKLLELGCGNGRDSLYFASNGLNVEAIDQVEEEIKYLTSLRCANATFVAGDFSDLSGYKEFDVVYSRFTFHSITEELEDKVLSSLASLLNQGGFFMVEARTTKDENLNKEFGVDHLRRYVDFEKIIEKISALGFEFVEQIESRGLAKYKSEDPYVLRIIAKK